MAETPNPLARKSAFIFLCDHATEPECLKRNLVGATQNAFWSLNVKVGDDIYLFNFNTGLVRGPYSAVSGADCHEPTAWSGRFPIQVKVSKTSLTKQAYNQTAVVPSVLRKRRPHGDVGDEAAELFAWLQEYGTPSE